MYYKGSGKVINHSKNLSNLEDKTGESEQTGLFGRVTVRKYQWDVAYNAASYIDVLKTYSGHINLDSSKRERLFHEIAELIDTKFNGCITKGYLTALYIAHRR